VRGRQPRNADPHPALVGRVEPDTSELIAKQSRQVVVNARRAVLDRQTVGCLVNRVGCLVNRTHISAHNRFAANRFSPGSSPPGACACRTSIPSTVHPALTLNEADFLFMLSMRDGRRRSLTRRQIVRRAGLEAANRGSEVDRGAAVVDPDGDCHRGRFGHVPQVHSRPLRRKLIRDAAHGDDLDLEVCATDGSLEDEAAPIPMEGLAAGSRPDDLPLERMRILVVEDEHKVASFIARALREEAYAVDVAATGQKALELASDATYDVILLDIRLPGLSGIEVCRELRQSGIETPILMLTARSLVAQRVEGLNVGADDYLTKPFAIAELRARVSRAHPSGTASRRIETQLRGHRARSSPATGDARRHRHSTQLQRICATGIYAAPVARTRYAQRDH